MFEKIRDLVAEQLGVNKDDIKPESRFKEDLNADSLDLFELIMSLEEEYSTEIPTDELENLTTIQSVIDYLGKYTHRIAVSYHHIICMDDKTVTFSVKDYDNKGHWKTLTISGVEFIRRFLMHVPQGILSGSVIMGYCVRVRKTKNCRYAEISSDVKSIFQGFMEKKCRKY